MIIREATRSDGMAVAEVFNYYVLHTAVTFETEPLAPGQMGERIVSVQTDGYPFYVLEHEGVIIGFYYLHQWNYRKGFRTSAELIIYVRHDNIHTHCASKMFDHLMSIVGNYNFHLLICTVTVPSDDQVGILKKYHFEKAAELKEVGRKFHEWHDIEQWVLKLE